MGGLWQEEPVITRLHHLGTRRLRSGVANRLVGWTSWAMWLTVRYWHHPLAHGRQIAAAGALWRWQVWRRLVRQPVVVELPEGSRLECPPWSTIASSWIAVGFHEYRETLFLLDYLRPGDGLVDVGANLGYYSVIAARCGARCLAFEPADRERTMVAANAARNGVGERVTLFPYALADYEGQASFSTDLESSNHLVGAGGETVESVTTVEVRTLDGVLPAEMLGEAAGRMVLKIDAEGYDLAVLQGGERLVRRARPAILVEIWAGGGAVRGWLEDRGYGIYRYAPGRLRLVAVPAEFTGEGMFLAVHQERLEETVARLAGRSHRVLHAPEVRWRP